MKEYKILVVDDYPEHIMMITEILLKDSYKYQILAAPNGKIAFQIAKKKLPHLIIMDWDMPVMNGMEATKKIRKDTDTQNIPIIISSGFHTDSNAMEEALNNGAIDFVRKPIDRVELVARVHSMLKFVESFQELIKQKELNFQQEILHKQKELSSHALSIVHQNEHLSCINNELKKLLKSANVKSKKIIYGLIENTNKKLAENAWEQFEDQIDDAYDHFYLKLTKRFPNLNQTERKLCGLLRINMTSKDIAQIIFQEASSIDVARYRLRQKLGLKKEESLSSFLSNLE